MPRRRRTLRPVRRPEFRPAPQGPSRDDIEATEDEEAPTFADEPVAANATAAFGATGPVDTTLHRVSRDQRAQGRRMAQLRRSSGDERAARRGMNGQLPTFATGYITHEIRQIAVTTVVMVAILIALTIVLR